MPIPKYNECLAPVLRLLSDEKEYYHKDITDIISDEFNLTEEEKNLLIPRGNQPIISNRIGWAKTYLKKAGLIESKNRGYVNITAKGLTEIKENPNLQEEDLYKFPEFLEFKPINNKHPKKIPVKTVLTPEEEINKNFEKINKELGNNIIETILDKSPIFFERLVLDLLLQMGYGEFKKERGKTTPASGDQGIDGIINEDKLGLDKIGIQAKRYNKNNKIGDPLIRDFIGALVTKGLNKGIFITTSAFTKEAKKTAKKQPNISISLIDGEKLAKLMIEYGLGTTTVSTYRIRKIDTDYFDTEY